MNQFSSMVEVLQQNDERPAERLSREQQLEILSAMTKPAPNIRWTQKDLDETVQHIYQQMHTIILKNVLPAVGKFVSAQVEPLKTRIAELESHGIKYCGVYQRAAEYRRGDVTSFEGAMWVTTCAVPPHEVPGKSVCWQLSVKSSNNGRRARADAA